MNNQLLLLAMAATVIAVSGCAQQRAASLPPGEYETKTESVNAAGTKTVQRKSTDVSVDAEGDRRTVVETESSTDPKGLFNKSTSTERRVVEE